MQQTPRRRVARMDVQTLTAPPAERVSRTASPWPVVGVPNHAILTKAQEQKLGKAIQRARKLRQWLELQPDDATNSNEQRMKQLPDDDAAVVYGLAPYQNYTQAQVDAILEKGHRAKQTLMMHNIKLVSGIAKKWALMTHNSNGEYTSYPFEGSWTRPSLQEAIQDGMEGLSKAAERFEPDRNWKFSTYATYWITNSIRTCYSKATSGHAMRLPKTYYERLGKYKALLKAQYQINQAAPPIEEMAAQMNIEVSLLHRILQLTQPPLSLESPARGFASAGKSGLAEPSAGVLGDILCMDAKDDPQVLVEWSMLRQALNHAMATELSPLERNVIRLRLGLDDGVTRTHQQVATDCYEGRFRASEIHATWKRALEKLRSPRVMSQYQWMSYFELCDVDIESVSWL